MGIQRPDGQLLFPPLSLFLCRKLPPPPPRCDSQGKLWYDIQQELRRQLKEAMHAKSIFLNGMSNLSFSDTRFVESLPPLVEGTFEAAALGLWREKERRGGWRDRLSKWTWRRGKLPPPLSRAHLTPFPVYIPTYARKRNKDYCGDLGSSAVMMMMRVLMFSFSLLPNPCGMDVAGKFCVFGFWKKKIA